MNILQEDINRSIAYLGERNEVFRGRHIVITGATGQIGQYLVALLKKLNEAGYGCTTVSYTHLIASQAN